MSDASPGESLSSSSKKRRKPSSPTPLQGDLEQEIEVVEVANNSNINSKHKSAEDSGSASTEEPQDVVEVHQVPDENLVSEEEGESESDGPERLRVLTWNVDMDTEYKSVRTRALISEVRACRPDVVMLQEVTDEDEEAANSVLKIVQRALCTPPTAEEEAMESEDVLTYNIYMPHTTHIYFCVMLIRRGLLLQQDAFFESRAVAFPGSVMARGYISVEGTLESSGAKVKFITSHLESLKMGAKQRVQQFANIRGQLEAAAEAGATAFFGGDTNLRESEVPKESVAKTVTDENKRARCLPPPDLGSPKKKKARVSSSKNTNKIGDAWIMAGAPADCKFTWDTLKNDNLDMTSAKFKPRSRYDRLFLMAAADKFPDVVAYRLLGTKKLNSCGKFISDHFGVLIDVDVLK